MVGLHPTGPAVFAAVGDRLQLRLAGAHVAELLGEPARTTDIGAVDRGEALDQLVERRYAGLVDPERLLEQYLRSQ